MKRQNPFLSPLGIILTLIMLTGLGLTFWFNGGLAFSPGDLSARGYSGVTVAGYASHADFEEQCRLCHQPLKTLQADLCLECHQDVGEQKATESGLHGQVENFQACALCHPEHRGRDFDITLAAAHLYDHSSTGFSLTWHQVNYDTTPMSCEACHLAATAGFPFDPQSCTTCHSSNNASFMSQHIADYGENCLDCHDGQDSMANFDHASTGFILEGKHGEAACVDCHTGGHFEDVPETCAQCHPEPDIHRGFLGVDCANCHSAHAWTPALIDGQAFDHDIQTSFSLVRHNSGFNGEPLVCTSCHSGGVKGVSFDRRVCIDCHQAAGAAFMSGHIQEFGEACLDCHDGIDRMHDFDHSGVFPLDGRHAGIACTGCHQNQVFAETPSECSGCHAEPEIHAGYFGLDCQSCHTTIAWSPAFLKEHTFPLNHGEGGESECRVCHPDNYVEYTCYGCHEHQPASIAGEHSEEGISATELKDCARCHPTGREEEGENEGD